MMGLSLGLNSGKRRSRLEIYMDILRITGYGVSKPTRIMFAANISWKSLNEALTSLEKCGLIERRTVRNHKHIFITERGKRILKALETISVELTAPTKLKTRNPIQSILESDV